MDKFVRIINKDGSITKPKSKVGVVNKKSIVNKKTFCY